MLGSGHRGHGVTDSEVQKGEITGFVLSLQLFCQPLRLLHHQHYHCQHLCSAKPCYKGFPRWETSNTEVERLLKDTQLLSVLFLILGGKQFFIKKVVSSAYLLLSFIRLSSFTFLVCLRFLSGLDIGFQQVLFLHVLR